jgi:hypothetical protein
MPTRSTDKRLRKYANLAAAAALLEFELCSYVAFGLLTRLRTRLRRGRRVTGDEEGVICDH